ncbi:hypothetical protein N7495_008754 [Penicillium taxi]|uniref:uncharacterized protein n=1 Tax=Penicillium taxi TaxID=168475 RepID=UPI002544F35C|nr:uncharacterized protein N7495_008754 [Penicillium taxi]KAJ5888713.1 hypothetical protein N7495_008754 [Penicillium taxi]
MSAPPSAAESAQSINDDYDWEIDLATATKREINDYVEKNMHFDDRTSDYNLWATYCDLFENWEPEHFKQVAPLRRTALRTNLLQHGVFVPRFGRGIAIYTLLSIVAQQEEFHEWTDEDIESFFTEFKMPMITGALRHRLNPTCTGLKQPLQGTLPP